MVLKIIQYPDPVLFEISKPVVDFNKDIDDLIENMISTAKKTYNCVGLAAIQVGIPLRISIIKDGKSFNHIVNPQVIESSSIFTEEWEGCMSVGIKEDQLFSKVSRDSKIKVKYFTRNGTQVIKTLTGFDAHAYLHEIDHMNGILFLSHVDDPLKIWKDKDLDLYIKKNKKLP